MRTIVRRKLTTHICRVVEKLGFDYCVGESTNAFDVFTYRYFDKPVFLVVEYLPQQDMFSASCYLSNTSKFPREEVPIMNPYDDDPQDGVLAFNLGALTGNCTGLFWNLEGKQLRSHEVPVFKKSVDSVMERIPHAVGDFEIILQDVLVPYLSEKQANQ